jgi:hypothetical protein
VRFLAELAKFKLAPPVLTLGCLKTCLDDFQHHSVDVACLLLESAGRFLTRSPESAARANTLVDIMWRLKKAKNLDAHQNTLVENAYYQCRPPTTSAVKYGCVFAPVSPCRHPEHLLCFLRSSRSGASGEKRHGVVVVSTKQKQTARSTSERTPKTNGSEIEAYERGEVNWTHCS